MCSFKYCSKQIKMFDFEKLEVYTVARKLNYKVFSFLYKSKSIDTHLQDQWKRASLSILLNLAEGTGRISINDKKHFITIARGSVNESVAILQILKDLDRIEERIYSDLYAKYEQVLKMLLGMYRSYSK